MTVTPPRATITRMTDATGRIIANPSEADIVEVQFNPETLDVTARNQVQEDRGKSQNKPPVQVVTSSEMSLSVQLIFDETISGVDVRARTAKLASFMRPGDTSLTGYGASGADVDARIPSIVKFEWGSFVFLGSIGEFTETLEYFSADGIPLRASVKLTVTDQSASFAAPSGEPRSADTSGGAPISPREPVPSGGNRQATNELARQNGVEDLRQPETDALHDPGPAGGAGSSVRGALGAAAAGGGAGAGIGIGAGGRFGLEASAMASGKVGLGLSAGIGLSAGGGISLGGGGVSLGGGGASLGGGGGAGFGVSAGASASFSASASVSASASASAVGMEAFAGLNPPKPLKSTVGAAKSLAGGAVSLGASAGAEAGVGGAGFGARAEVGGKIDLASILFGEG